MRSAQSGTVHINTYEDQLIQSPELEEIFKL